MRSEFSASLQPDLRHGQGRRASDHCANALPGGSADFTEAGRQWHVLHMFEQMVVDETYAKYSWVGID